MAKKSKRKNRSARERIRREEELRRRAEKEQDDTLHMFMKMIMIFMLFVTAHLLVMTLIGAMTSNSWLLFSIIAGMIAIGTFCLISFAANNDKDTRNLSIEMIACAGVLIIAYAFATR